MLIKHFKFHTASFLSQFLIVTLLVFAGVITAQSPASAFFSPDLEKLTSSEINEMLQSKRAKSKSDIKRLMEWGYVIPGGDAPSGLRLAKFGEWHPKLYRRNSFGIQGGTIQLSDFNSVSYWDIATRELKEVIVCEDDKYSIVGNAPGSSELIISRYEKKHDEYYVLVKFATVDKNTLKKKTELSSSLPIWGNKNDFRRDTGLWSAAAYATSRDGSLFMVTNDKGQHFVENLRTGKTIILSLNAYPSDSKPVPFNQISPDGTKYFTTLGDKKRAVFDARTHKQLGEIPQVYRMVSFSPNGKYMTAGRAFMTADGKKKLFEMKRPNKLFLPGIDYLLDCYTNGIIFQLIDKDGLLVIGRQSYKSLGKYLRETIVSRDGKYLFLAFDNYMNFVGVSDGHKFQVVEIKKPAENKVKLISDAERAIELYKAGLTKQGLARMHALIANDPLGLWLQDYDQKIYRAGLPLVLNSKLLIPLIREGNQAIRNGKTPDSILPGRYNAYMLYALAAGQPTAATQAYIPLSKGSKDRTLMLKPRVASFSILLRTLCLKMMGKDDDAYSYLIDKAAKIEGLAPAVLTYLKMYPEIFRPLLLEKKKLAVILDIDPGKLPAAGKKLAKQDYMGLDGTLLKGAPPKPGMAPGAKPASHEGQKPGTQKKKTSVVLD